MSFLLICPSERPSVRRLAEPVPLALVPVMGQSLLEYWLSYLAGQRVRHVHLLAPDRPEQFQAIAAEGPRWGMTIEVIAESRELTPEEALLKYEHEIRPVCGVSNIALLEHFPAEPQLPLFGSYASWFAAVLAWMPRAQLPDRVGMREVRPGIWQGLHAYVSPKAQLEAPCWIGHHVFIGAQAHIGPQVVLENGAFVESGTEITQSWVGPDTYVGRYTEIKESLAWGNTLTNWQSGSSAEVPDSFVLCALRRPHPASLSRWVHRVTELFSRDKEETLQVVSKQLLVDKPGP